MNYLKKKIDKLYKLIHNSEKIIDDLKYLQSGGALTNILLLNSILLFVNKWLVKFLKIKNY